MGNFHNLKVCKEPYCERPYQYEKATRTNSCILAKHLKRPQVILYKCLTLFKFLILTPSEVSFTKGRGSLWFD